VDRSEAPLGGGMRISLVVAVSENGVIGRDVGLPWHLPADLQHFKRVTLGHPILMGRRTHESIGRPLPGRANLILSRNPDYIAPGCAVVRNWTRALEAADDAAELMVIGGEAVYRLALAQADRIYLTRVHADVEGDAHFPDLNPADWREMQSRARPADDANAFDLTFIVLDRVRSSQR